MSSLGSYPSPLVLTVGRRGLALVVLPAVVVCAFISMVLIPHPAGWFAAIITTVFGAVAVASVVKPGTLTIDETGFTSRHLGLVRHWSWAGTSGYHTRLRGRIPNVFFDADPAELDTPGKRLFKALGGSLPGYGVNANDLAVTLATYREAAQGHS